MGYLDDLGEDLYKDLKTIVDGFVNSRTRDAEAVSYENISEVSLGKCVRVL